MMDDSSPTPTSHSSANDSSVMQPALPGHGGGSLWTPHKILVFVLLALVYFLNWCCVGVLAPFFPNVAKNFGISSTVTGLILGSYNLVAFSVSFLYGSILVPKMGPYFVLFCGLFINGGANIIFGFLNLLSNGPMFAGFCFLVRAVGAIGGSACETAVMVILIGEFRENVSAVIGILELFTGLGFVISPVIGGGLYSLGGFKLPFFVTGGLLLLALPLVWCVIPRKEGVGIAKPDKTKKYSLKKAMVIPGVVVMCMTMFINTLSVTFLDAILAPFAEQLGVNSAGVGLLFFWYSLSYMICTPIVGKVLQHKEWRHFSLISGLLWVGVCDLVLGPAPFLTSFIPQRKVWLIGLSMGFSGIGYAALFVPLIPELLVCCHKRGFPKDTFTDSLVSGLYNGFSNMGGFAGPVSGGFIEANLGFQWTSTIIGFLVMSQAAVLGIFFSCNRRRTLSTDTEQINLLASDNHDINEPTALYGSIKT